MTSPRLLPLAPLPLWTLLAACSPAKVGLDTNTGPDDTSPGPTDDTSGETGGPSAGRFFPDDAIWYSDVSDETPDPDSETVTSWLDSQGWGLGRFQIDRSLDLVKADADTELRSFEPTSDFYSPDCDALPIPIPEGGNIEGEDGYACTSGGDCHLLVEQRSTLQLFEMWRADIEGDVFNGGCLAVWDMSRVYGEEGRGEQCTSADAAGYPIAPLTFSADEVASGEIDHAIRFILPNESIRAGVYVHPATHAGGPSGPDTAPPYGSRLRLRADYDLSALPNDNARVVARALQRYGMFLADGGSIALTALSDRHTTAKWDDVLDVHDLEDIEPADFELMPMGEIIPLTYDCVRAD